MMSFSFRNIDADVIIIGGGVAGFTAAFNLLERLPSLQVLILETTDHPGGRTSNLPYMDTQCDVGGDYFYSNQEELWLLLKKIKLKLVEKKRLTPLHIILSLNNQIWPCQIDSFYRMLTLSEKNQLKHFIRYINQLCENKDVVDSFGTITMDIFIDFHLNSNNNRKIMKYLIMLHCGLSATDITVDFYLFYCASCGGIASQLIEYEKKYYIEQGSHRICENIIDALGIFNFHICEEVQSIKSSAREVEVVTNIRQYYCFNVIVAIPPPSIRNINFSPDLPVEFWDVISNARKGQLAKFLSIYIETFWHTANFSGDVYCLDEPTKMNPLVNCYNLNENYLIPILSGYYLKQENVNSLQIELLKQLSTIFGQKALEPVHFIEKLWCEGAPMNCLRNFNDVLILKKQRDRICFAGAETSTEWYGHIAGAVISGKRAAIETLCDLRPQIITKEDIKFLETNNKKSTKIRRVSNFINPNKRDIIELIIIPLILTTLFIAYKIWRRGTLRK